MNQKIKLIWDFRGPDAQKIAEHHVIHLNQYVEANNLEKDATGIEIKSPLYSTAFLIVTKEQMLVVRDALKPHRGEFSD